MSSPDEIIARHREGAAASNGQASPVAPDLTTLVAYEKARLLARHQAEAELLDASTPPLPHMLPLADFLTEADDEPVYRIADLWPAGGNVVLAAQFKAGKTTMRDNLIRSVCDGEPFLGSFPVAPPEGRVALLDVEMSRKSARRWLGDQGIVNTGRCEYVNLRGQAGAFNILSPRVRALWASRLSAAGVSILILDCIGPVLATLGLDENKASEVGRFLGAFEQLLAESAVSESLTIHHMGHAEERARGASRLRDWPDAEWRLVRQDDNPASPRYLSAYGRDVDVHESRLAYDEPSRHLTLAGGSRKSERAGEALNAIRKLLSDETDGLSGNAIEKTIGAAGHSRAAIREALAKGVADSSLIAEDGPRNARIYRRGPL